MSYTPRRPLDDDKPYGLLESDNDYVKENMELAVWLLDNYGPAGDTTEEVTA